MTRAFWSLSLVLVVACNQSDFADDEEVNPDGPGTPQWGDVDVTCERDADCNYGEACSEGICQMKRCGKEYDSEAPLGVRRTLLVDREIVVADGGMSRGYAPNGAPGGAWAVSGTIIDVTGGALLEDGPELVAMARSGNNSISIPKINKTVNPGFQPVAITTGDVDHDGLDEIVALGGAGQVAICNVDSPGCKRYDFNSGTIGYDVAAGDIDGDGIDEIVFHLDRGEPVLTVWNLDSDKTGQPEIQQVASPLFMGLAIVDVNGDGRSEIFGLEEGGWLGFASDYVYMFTSNGSALAQGASVATTKNALDLAGSDLDHDQQGELVVLSDDKTAGIYRGTGMTFAYQSTLSTSYAPTKIAMVDFDGDSTIGKLMVGPELVAGEIVPTTVLYMPPYYETLSSGRPSVYVGNSTSSGESKSDSFGLSIGMTVGVSGEIPGIVSAELSASLEKETTYSKTFESTVTVMNRFSVEANPELYGVDSAAVALSCGCYHSYTYQLTGPSGSKVVVLVPVGGQTLLWSSKRYNAMAKAVGNLPTIDVASRVGDARSYPTSAQKSDGQPIAPGDLVFSSSPAIRVSDVATVEWSLSHEQVMTNETATTTNVGVDASVTVAGVKLGGSVGLSWEQGYAVSVGSDFELGGTVPPLADNPNTPEDEYTTYAYGFKPSVYRQHYTGKDGKDAAFYVVNYAVDF